jgi:hypothetical protein
MRSVLRGACLTWIANAFRPEGAPTNQPQASPGEQATIKPPSPERAAQRDEGGTSLSLRRAWFSVGALTTPFTKLQGLPLTAQKLFFTGPEVSIDLRRAERQIAFMVICQAHWFFEAANQWHVTRIFKGRNH